MAEQKANDCHLDVSTVAVLTNIFLSFLFSPYFDSFFSIIEVEKEKRRRMEFSLQFLFYFVLFYSVVYTEKKKKIMDP